MRMGDNISLGQLRESDPDVINQYSVASDFERAGLRPSLFPTDTTPMGVEEAMPNPGRAELLRSGEITELTPAGAQSVLVYPGVAPAPDDTTNISYEDTTWDQRYQPILSARNRVSVYGNMPAPQIGPALWGLGQAEEDPISYWKDPASVAYQTFPGPSLGQLAGKGSVPGTNGAALAAALTVGVGATLAFVGHDWVDSKRAKETMTFVGGFAAAIGLVNFIEAVTKS